MWCLVTPDLVEFGIPPGRIAIGDLFHRKQEATLSEKIGVAADLQRMAEWLKRCGIRTVAMQSTGVYSALQ